MSVSLPFRNINEFFLQEVIQDGPYTIIFRGYQKNLKRNVLIKLLKPQASEELKNRFDREARVYARLSHPHIVSVYALGEIKGYLYIILEFVHGCSLRTLMEQTSLTLPVIWEIGHSILDALKHADGSHVVHRDIKPANIMIDRDGKVKVTDFGLALLADEPHITKQQALIGTPAYMSPEQITGADIDLRSDIFSFGSLLYEMIYKEQAFGSESFSASINSILNDIPPKLNTEDTVSLPLKTFLQKCLQKDKNERWASIDQALHAWQEMKKDLTAEKIPGALAKLVADYGDHTEGEATISNIPERKKPLKITGILASILALILFVVVFYLQEEEINSGDATLIVSKNDSARANENKADSIINTVPQKETLIKEKVATQQKARAAVPVEQDLNKDTLRAILPQPARLQFDIIPWARVYLNDSLIDSHLVRKNISLKAARYSVLLEHPRFRDERQNILLQPGENKMIQWSFWEKTGYLDVQVRPWADIYINNEYFDTTPLKKPLQLPVGIQVLELRHPSLENYREIITIIQSDTLVIKKNLF